MKIDYCLRINKYFHIKYDIESSNLYTKTKVCS